MVEHNFNRFKLSATKLKNESLSHGDFFSILRQATETLRLKPESNTEEKSSFRNKFHRKI